MIYALEDRKYSLDYAAIDMAVTIRHPWREFCYGVSASIIIALFSLAAFSY
jgi:hypothetical protein